MSYKSQSLFKSGSQTSVRGQKFFSILSDPSGATPSKKSMLRSSFPRGVNIWALSHLLRPQACTVKWKSTNASQTHAYIVQSVKIRLGGSCANALLDFWVPGVKKTWMSVSVNHAKMERPVKMAPIASGNTLSLVLFTSFIFSTIQSFCSLYGV